MKCKALIILMLLSITLNSYADTGKPKPSTTRAVTEMTKKLSKLTASCLASRKADDDSHYCAGAMTVVLDPAGVFALGFVSLTLEKFYNLDPAFANGSGAYQWDLKGNLYEIVYFGSKDLSSYFKPIFDEAAETIRVQSGGFPFEYSDLRTVVDCK